MVVAAYPLVTFSPAGPVRDSSCPFSAASWCVVDSVCVCVFFIDYERNSRCVYVAREVLFEVSFLSLALKSFASGSPSNVTDHFWFTVRMCVCVCQCVFSLQLQLPTPDAKYDAFPAHCTRLQSYALYPNEPLAKGALVHRPITQFT